MKKIGVFAGVFDPIHLGHTEFIKQAIKTKKLDRVYLLVEENPKYKNCIAPYADRQEMARLATTDIGEAEVYEPSAKTFPITSTLPQIRDANPDGEIFLLLGDDVAAHINEWQDTQALQGVELIVADRGLEDEYSKVSSLKIRNQLKDGTGNPALAPAVLEYCERNGLY